MFRLAAISNNHYKNKSGHFVITNETMEAPLDRYYRGLEELGPFESNMFLAEDCVLGLEIVFQEKKDYTLTYEPAEVAITDSCDTIEELFKQPAILIMK